MPWFAVFLAVAFVSGNNLSACVGTAIGARIVSHRTGVSLGALGFALGLLGQGSSMIRTVHVILPISNSLIASEVLLVTVAVFLVADIARIPFPLTMSLVGLVAGVSTAHNLPIDQTFFVTVVSVWFVAPVIALVLTFYSVRILDKMSPINLWRRLAFYKVLLITFSLLNAYVLGANTLGLIVAIAGFSNLTASIGILGILFGSFFLSSGPVKRIGEELFSLRYSSAFASLLLTTILVESATFFSIPLSNTQTLSAGVFGAGISYERKYISIWPFIIVVIGWILALSLSFVIGLLL